MTTPPHPMMRLDMLLGEYNAWCKHRRELAERDVPDDPPRANEWHASDDEAVDLLHAFAREVRAEMEFIHGFNEGDQ